MANLPSTGAAAAPKVRSDVTLISLDGRREVIFSAPRLYEAPNWSPDGKFLVLNSEGKLWRLPISGGQPELIPMGAVKAINNDHGISPDGKQLVVSASGGPMYIMPISGGEPRPISPQIPSFYHGWSPDGKTVAYVARSEKAYDLYAIDIAGGQPRRLTCVPKHDDGPDYSPDGKWIYFNSDRAGGGNIWRMPADGAGPNDEKAQPVTSDENFVDWFPHPSPDGKWLVFLSYPKGTSGHPANKDVCLRLMSLPGEQVGQPRIRELVRLFGGQGTINVNSWSPDSRRLAYVSYTLID